MKFIIFGGLIAAAVLSTASASAETFNGPFVGLQGGWDHLSVGSTGSKIGEIDLQKSNDAFIGGVLVGYDHRFADHLVIGGEAAFSVSTKDALQRLGKDSNVRLNPSHGFDLSARAGYLINAMTLVYGRAGYDNVRASVRLVDKSSVRSAKDTFDGWTVGGGVERSLGDAASVRIEYRYSDLSSGGGNFDRSQILFGVVMHL